MDGDAVRGEHDRAARPSDEQCRQRREKSTVKVAAPMRRDNNVRRTFRASRWARWFTSVSVMYQRSFTLRASPPSGFGRHHLQGRPHAHDALYWPLPVLTGGLEKSLDASQAVDRFSLPPFAHGPRHRAFAGGASGHRPARAWPGLQDAHRPR